MELAYGLPGFGLLRFPVKFLLLAAVGLALLGGIACERLAETAAWRKLRPGLWLAAAAVRRLFPGGDPRAPAARPAALFASTPACRRPWSSCSAAGWAPPP